MSDREAMASLDRLAFAGPADPPPLDCADGYHVFDRGECERCGDPPGDALFAGCEYDITTNDGVEYRGHVVTVPDEARDGVWLSYRGNGRFYLTSVDVWKAVPR